MLVFEKWDSASFDTISLNDCLEDKCSFFDTDVVGDSDEDLRGVEPVVTRFLLDRFRNELLTLCKHDPENSKHHLEVVEPFTHKHQKPGDIDLLVYDERDFSRVTAVEFKVLRKRQCDEENEYLQGYKKIAEGVEQARGLVKLGFGSVFLGIIVIANVSHQQNFNLLGRKIRSVNWGRIRCRYVDLVRGDRIGLLNIEINQTSAKKVGLTGNISGYNFRTRFQEQDSSIPQKLSNWLK